MDDSATGRPNGAAQRRGRRHAAGSSVLTPPTGMAAVPDVEVSVPTQRTASVGPVAPIKRPAPPVVVGACTCGHGKAAHEHYRAGTDCGVCGAATCAAFQSAERRGLLRRLFRRS
jgi:hypothetical protein